MVRLSLSLVALLGALATSAAAQEGVLHINDVTVFDGDRRLGVRDVLIRDGRIAAVAETVPAPSDAVTVDGRGRYLIPGLIDSHVHVFPSAAEDALRFGVTTEMDMFTLADPATVAARKAQRLGTAPTTAADVWSAGRGVTPPGGHPTPLARGMGVDIPTLAPDGDARAFVAAEVAEGSDYIKIFQDESRDAQGRPRFPEFPEAQFGQIIAAVHDLDRKAVVHVSTDADARQAFRLGADAIAHMFDDQPATPETVDAIKAADGVVIATLSVLAGASGDDSSARLAEDPAVAPHLSPMQKGMISTPFPRPRPEVLANALESVRRMNAAGIVILAGTDAPNPTTAHGPSLHQELALLVRGGLTPEQALNAATAAAADFFGLSDRGRVAPGLKADLILLEGDPAQDITATRRIVTIWKNGREVDRALLPSPPGPPGR